MNISTPLEYSNKRKRIKNKKEIKNVYYPLIFCFSLKMFEIDIENIENNCILYGKI